MWFLNSPLVFLSLLIGRWENLRHCFFMVSAAFNFKRRSFKSRKRKRIKATSSWRQLESNWTSGNILEHTESDLQRELVKHCHYLMWKAQQNNFCFCYFAEGFMLKAKIGFSERLCVTWFLLAKTIFVFASVYYVSVFGFSPRHSEKAKWHFTSFSPIVLKIKY